MDKKMNQQPNLHATRAYFYSPLSFLHQHQAVLAEQVLTDLNQAIENGDIQTIHHNDTRLLIKHLAWDSNYFACPTYRIEFTDWDTTLTHPIENLTVTIRQFLINLSARHAQYYLFAEIPSEDLITLQTLGNAGFKLIETRLTYFRDDLDKFSWERRSAVRKATIADIPNLRQVAMQARNLYDRFHADPFFSQSIADEFLATFIENSIQGFADIVLVPDETENLPDAFFTGKILQFNNQLKLDIGKIILVAVGEKRRGWHIQLMTEMNYWFQERGIKLVYMTTQSTNKAVIRNCEKLGYKYGRSTHILAIHS